MIFIQKVPRTCSIVVLGVPAGVGNEYISLYFEKHGETDVTHVKSANDHVILMFADFEGNLQIFVPAALLCYNLFLV